MVSGHLKLIIIPYLVGPILNNVVPCTLLDFFSICHYESIWFSSQFSIESVFPFDWHFLYVRKFAIVLFSGSLNF